MAKSQKAVRLSKQESSFSPLSLVVVEERRGPPPPPPTHTHTHMIEKRFGCTTIHNKALYKCIIHSYTYSNKILTKIKHRNVNLMLMCWTSWVTSDCSFQWIRLTDTILCLHSCNLLFWFTQFKVVICWIISLEYNVAIWNLPLFFASLTSFTSGS